MANHPAELKGKRFGRLEVIERVFPNVDGNSNWSCKCDCGNTTCVVASSLMRVRSTHSCGCITKESLRAIATRHGKSSLSEYRIYKGMKYRCYNKENKDYAGYGGRGIKMANRWLGDDGFINFLTDVGPRPEGTSIERKDVNGDYSPENCVWADNYTQQKNRRRFAALENHLDADLIREYERRFPTPEYGMSGC